MDSKITKHNYTIVGYFNISCKVNFKGSGVKVKVIIMANFRKPLLWL